LELKLAEIGTMTRSGPAKRRGIPSLSKISFAKHIGDFVKAAVDEMFEATATDNGRGCQQ
jgi:hypothetical protein